MEDNKNNIDEENCKKINSNDYYELSVVEVEKERKSYVQKLFYLFEFINTSTQKEANDEKDTSFYSSFCKSYSEMFKSYNNKYLNQ